MKKVTYFNWKTWVVIVCLCMIGNGCFGAEVEHCENITQTISIYETTFESSIQELTWLQDARTHQTLYARTDVSLWKSFDEGQNWSEELTALNSARGSQKSGSYLIESVISITSDKAVIIGSNGNLWTTRDGGHTYTYLTSAAQDISFMYVVRLLPNYGNEDWLLAFVGSPRCWNASASGYCYFSLKVSTNLGTSWTLVDTYVRVFAWGTNGKFYYDSYPTKNGHQYSSNPLGYDMYSTNVNNLANKVKLFNKCGGLVMKNQVLFVAQQSSIPGSLQLFSSRNYGENQFLKVELPVDLSETRYTILDTGDDFFFINVEHQGDPQMGNLYVSNNNDTNFVLSLRNNVRSVTGHCDFINIQRLNGIYLANYYPDSSDTNTVKTLISYNKGGEWLPLTPPAKDINGKPFLCTTGCSLQLHLIHRDGHLYTDDDTTPFGPIYSKFNAVGLIIGVGNVGRSLSTDITAVGTFFSRDGGVSWVQLARGSNVYEFADHGALTVVANNIQETVDIQFSLNQSNFTTCHFTNPLARLDVEDIIAEPNNTEATVVLVGKRMENGVQKGVAVYMDFSQVFSRQCGAADYEQWSPSDQSGRNCYLGKTETYLRRKQDADCFNGNEFETETQVAICPCAQQDYECDYCFEALESSPEYCVAICNDTIEQPPNCFNYYYISRGYRLVDGDVCDPKTGLDLLPLKKKCENPPVPSPSSPAVHPKKNLSNVIAAVSVLLTLGFIVLVCGGLILYSLKNAKARSYLESRLPNRFRNVGFQPLQAEPTGSGSPSIDDMGEEAEEILN